MAGILGKSVFIAASQRNLCELVSEVTCHAYIVLIQVKLLGSIHRTRDRRDHVCPVPGRHLRFRFHARVTRHSRQAYGYPTGQYIQVCSAVS